MSFENTYTAFDLFSSEGAERSFDDDGDNDGTAAGVVNEEEEEDDDYRSTCLLQITMNQPFQETENNNSNSRRWRCSCAIQHHGEQHQTTKMVDEPAIWGLYLHIYYKRRQQ
jgi:hypothetical protein